MKDTMNEDQIRIAINKMLYLYESVMELGMISDGDFWDIQIPNDPEIKILHEQTRFAYCNKRVKTFQYYAMRLIIALQEMIPVKRTGHSYHLGDNGIRYKYVQGDKESRKIAKQCAMLDRMTPTNTRRKEQLNA